MTVPPPPATAANQTALSQALAGAVVDAVRIFRADDRLYRLPPGAPLRRKILKETVHEVSQAWQVGFEDLRQELIRQLEGREQSF